MGVFGETNKFLMRN